MAAEGTQQRQREIVSEAYERFGSGLYRYLSVLTGRRQLAEDIMQEVFLRLWRVARRDPDVLQSRSYVLRVARNEAYRSLARNKRREIEQTDRLLEIRDPRQGSESERVAIEEALVRLPHEQREVIHLKTYMSMTFEEIARFTAVSQNTAASRYRYALRKLRELLSDRREES